MRSKILKCPDCGRYTLKENCPVCGARTVYSRPPRFSLNDRYVKYRRMLKEVAEKGD